MQISLRNSKEKLVKCATEVARLHKVSHDTKLYTKTAVSESSIALGRLNLTFLSFGLSL